MSFSGLESEHPFILYIGKDDTMLIFKMMKQHPIPDDMHRDREITRGILSRDLTSSTYEGTAGFGVFHDVHFHNSILSPHTSVFQQARNGARLFVDALFFFEYLNLGFSRSIDLNGSMGPAFRENYYSKIDLNRGAIVA